MPNHGQYDEAADDEPATDLHPTFARIFEDFGMTGKSLQRQIDEHLGLSGPKPKITVAQMTEWLRDKADDECDAVDAFWLDEIAERIEALAAKAAES